MSKNLLFQTTTDFEFHFAQHLGNKNSALRAKLKLCVTALAGPDRPDQPGPAWTDLDQPGAAQTGPDQPGLARTGLDPPGPDQTSPDRPGPAWASLDRPGVAQTSPDQGIGTALAQRGSICGP